MALGTHEIPVLVQLGPVQDIVVLDLLVGIEMKPTLTTLFLWSAVPGNRKGLQAAIREFNEELLQGIDAECVFDLKDSKVAVGTIGFNKELVVVFEKTGMDGEVVEAGIIEI